MTTTADTTSRTDEAVVRAGFDAFARGDGAAFAAMFHADATWNHRNDDRLGGVHDGRDRIMAFLAESAQLTAGTLRAVPERLMADGDGSVAVVTRVSGGAPTAAGSTTCRSSSSRSRRSTSGPSTSTSEIPPP